MKTLLLIIAAGALASCTTVTTTAPDGTVTVTKAFDIPGFNAVSSAVTPLVLAARQPTGK